MLKIGEFSKLAQVSVKTLRYYDEVGLFHPEWVDRFSGYRYYTLQQLPRLHRILTLRELGFPLVQIERLLQEDLSVAELQRLMRLRKAELEEQVAAEQARLKRVAARLRLIEQEGSQPRYDVVLKRVPPQLVAGIRGKVSGDADLRCLLEELYTALADKPVASGPLMPFTAIYYDVEFQEGGADVEVALALRRRLRAPGRVTVHELPGVEQAACVIHQGSPSRLPAAYRALTVWSQANGYRPGPHSREIYLHGYADDALQNDCVIELQLPVQPIFSSSKAKETLMQEPKIVEKAAFTVVGLPFTGFVSKDPYADGKNNEIGDVWAQFDARYAEIPHTVDEFYGVCFGKPNSEKPWYLAGGGVSQVGDIPEGMMSLSIPAQRYAVFECTLGTLGDTYRAIVEEWQPRTGHQHGDGPEFEYYPNESEPGDESSMKMAVYWPIR